MPTGISPLAMRLPPNQTTATLDRFITSMSAGIISAKIRLTRSVVSVRSAFASANRASSCSVRTNARITRMPVRFSRSTRLMRSILTCMARNNGTALTITPPMRAIMIGTITSSSSDSGASCRIAMRNPPTAMSGAVIITVSATCMNIWTCWTSLVLRVISDGAPNVFISRSANVSTWPKMRARMSRPTDIAVREAK